MTGLVLALAYIVGFALVVFGVFYLINKT